MPKFIEVKWPKSRRSQVGGLSRSMAYALENEAYRKLAGYLTAHYQLEMKEKLIRTEVADEEINIFGIASQNGEDVIIVGEVVLKLDDQSKLAKLDKKIKAVRKEYSQKIIPLMLTHFARSIIVEKAKEKGVLVVQSFQWD